MMMHDLGQLRYTILYGLEEQSGGDEEVGLA